MSKTNVTLEIELPALHGQAGESSLAPHLVQSQSDDDAAPSHAVSLPPMDRGFDAWAFLISAFVIELLVWAYPYSYGVFLDYYRSHAFKGANSALLPLVGSLSSGIMYLSSPFLVPLMTRFPKQKKPLMIFGACLCGSGLFGAAFAKEPWHLIVTQGIMYSLGGALLYFPIMTLLYDWFQEKKGFANGLVFSGTGVGGVVIPFIVERLLRNYGLKTTFLSLAISFGILVLPTFRFIKPRTPPALVVEPRSMELGFLYRAPFWILFTSNVIQGLANFVPSLWLPTFAQDLHLSNTSSVIAISVMNGFQALGLIFMGYLSDNFDIRVSILISTLGSSLAVFFLWGFSSSLAPLVLFAAVYGFLAPSWSALWPRFISSVAGDDVQTSATLMSIFIAGRGIGNVLSAPISAGLLHPWSLTDRSHFAYGLKGYGPLITFTGATLFISTLGIGFKSFSRNETREPRRWRR